VRKVTLSVAEAGEIRSALIPTTAMMALKSERMPIHMADLFCLPDFRPALSKQNANHSHAGSEPPTP
jgi:hypothetical protein